MTDPEISVMMPTYGQSQYLLKAVESITSQTPCPAIYLVWVETDWATEKQLESVRGKSLLREFFVESPNVWVQKEEALSLAKTYTTGLVCRFDSDDIIYPGWLAKAVPLAKEIQARGKVPIIGPSYIMTDENLKPTQTVTLPEFSMEKMLESCIIPEYSVMPIGPMLEVGGFYPKDYPEGVPDRYRWYAMMLRILKKYDCEVRLLPDIGFYYRQHRGQAHTRFTSKLRSKRNVEMIKKVSKHYFPEGI